MLFINPLASISAPVSSYRVNTDKHHLGLRPGCKLKTYASEQRCYWYLDLLIRAFLRSRCRRYL